MLNFFHLEIIAFSRPSRSMHVFAKSSALEIPGKFAETLFVTSDYAVIFEGGEFYLDLLLSVEGKHVKCKCVLDEIEISTFLIFSSYSVFPKQPSILL